MYATQIPSVHIGISTYTKVECTFFLYWILRNVVQWLGATTQVYIDNHDPILANKSALFQVSKVTLGMLKIINDIGSSAVPIEKKILA